VGKLSRADRSAQLVLGLLSNLFDGIVIVNEFCINCFALPELAAPGVPNHSKRG
jgi:hypothetical protein